jgi:hypothetical protein
LERENDLFVACRILFGPDIIPSAGFLEYLQEEGIISAFRRRAKEIHPDKALISGNSLEQCQKEFIALQAACEILREYITCRAKRTVQKNSQAGTGKGIRKNGALPKTELPFGRFLFHLGIIEWSQLIKALAWQKSGRLRIGELGVQRGYLDRNSVGIILKNSGVKNTFGLTAYRLGFLTKEEVRDLLQRQRRQQKRIGQFFVENGLLSRVELEILLGQCRKHNSEMRRLT